MRFQVFNTQSGREPVLSAPWARLAWVLTSRASARWDAYRLVDSRTGRTLIHWARAKRADRNEAERLAAIYSNTDPQSILGPNTLRITDKR